MFKIRLKGSVPIQQRTKQYPIKAEVYDLNILFAQNSNKWNTFIAPGPVNSRMLSADSFATI